MAKKPETVFREWTYKYLNALPNSWFESIQQRSIRGTPDVIGCVSGWFVALEYKRAGKIKLEPLQEYKGFKIVESGGYSIKVTPDNWEQIHLLLTNLANEGKRSKRWVLL